MNFAGIDGCPFGWFCVQIENKRFTCFLVENLSQLPSGFLSNNRIWIDMPIGFASKNIKRSLDAKLRKKLGNKSSSVFTPPLREALNENNKKAAKSINKDISGKSLSEQILNIMPKMRELDNFLQQYPEHNIFESHPELNFKSLNKNRDLNTKKGKKSGFKQRLEILSKHNSKIPAFVENVLQQELRKNVKKDDILDASCLALANYLAGENRFNLIENDPEFPVDDCGIPIRVAYLKS